MLRLSLFFALVFTVLFPAVAISAPTPAEALNELKRGNLRYLEGISKHPRIDPAERLRTAKKGQSPIASVLACADARVPVELVFDKGFGELFVVRVAGNVCKVAELASLEYGALYLNTPLIVVLGHSSCGAVQAAIGGKELQGKLPLLVKQIKPAVDTARIKNAKATASELETAAIKENVRQSIRHILKSKGVRKAVNKKKVKIVGAVRNLKTGKIEWLD